MPCMAVSQLQNIIVKDHEYDLAKLQRSQLAENLTSIRKIKNSMHKFGSLIMCITFYVQNYFLLLAIFFRSNENLLKDRLLNIQLNWEKILRIL